MDPAVALSTAAAAALSYGAGALPFSVWIARARGVDIRAVGSGNPGATNVARVLGRGHGALALVLDLSKGLLAVAVCAGLGAAPSWAALAVLGHNWSPFLRFHGGKGVATTLGVLVGVHWPAALATVGVWLLVTLLTRKVSLGSILALLTAPLALWALEAGTALVLTFAGLGVLSLVQHRANLQRLWRGEESAAPLSGKRDAR